MTTPSRFCEQCGAALPLQARFCEMCGHPINAATPAVQPVSVAPPAQIEAVIVHLPAEMLGKGLIGWGKKISLVITTERLLCLRETKAIKKKWDDEIERLMQQEETSGTPWRTLIDNYDWRNPLWADLYNTPPAKLLSAHKDNVSIPMASITLAAVTLNEEQDQLEIKLSDGETRKFLFDSLVGQAAAHFLNQVLGPGRVRTQ